MEVEGTMWTVFKKLAVKERDNGTAGAGSGEVYSS